MPSFSLGKDTNEDITQNETLDKILGAIFYKVKLGVDCEIISQIVGIVAIAAINQLSGFKPLMKRSDAIIEVCIRYNF